MKLRTFIIIAVLVVIFIWGHSLVPVSGSALESARIMALMQKVLNKLHIPIILTDHIVRKMAHFIEYTVLGTVLGFYPAKKSEKKRALIRALQIGFFIAFFDETLQLFSGRGAMIQDVWLDFSGVVLGIVISAVVYEIFFRKKETEGSVK